MKTPKQKFIIYTNPNNVTNYAYCSVGTQAVREVKKDMAKYRDSYRMIFEGSGTPEDIQKTKESFSWYRFSN